MPAGKPRKHLRDSVASLERLASQNRNNPEILDCIAQELEHRKTRSARQLQARVHKVIAQARSPAAVSAVESTIAERDSQPAEPTEVQGAPKVPQMAARAEGGWVQQGGSEVAIIATPRMDQSSEPLPRLVARPWFLARLLPGKWHSLRLENDGLRTIRGSRSELLSWDAISAARADEGLLSASLEITERSRGRLRSFTWLKRADARTLATALNVRAHLDETRNAVEVFQRLLANEGYLNHTPVAEWALAVEHLREQLAPVDMQIARELGMEKQATVIAACISLLATYEQRVADRNDAFVADRAVECGQFFSRLEKHPLTTRQVEAVLRDEDHALVVAGAGTGKTSTVVGKVGYLLEAGIVEPREVLALAFARKAAAEMQERVEERTGREVEIRTFHSIGRQILIEVEDEKPAIASMASDDRELVAWVANTLGEVLSDPEQRERYVSFVVYHRYPAKYIDQFTERGDYLEYLKALEPRTLKGELVKSFEERLIADWLTINGVEYEYEFPYEHNTATKTKRQYKPDFFLRDYGIYLEHFGIDRQGRTAPGIPAEQYMEGIRWKRDLHEMKRTHLIETYSYERMEGMLLQGLEKKLTDAGVALEPVSDEELMRLVKHAGVHGEVAALMKDFLTVFKENLGDLDVLHARGQAGDDRERARAFYDLFSVVYERYQARLSERREIDFADMIVLATRHVLTGAYRPRFTRIIVDEFQDISRGRLNFLLALLRSVPGARIFCVGDDWQSIYGFTGSDVSVMTKFQEVFGHTARTDLDIAFRFHDKALSASSRFVQENPTQLRKSLTSMREHDGPAIRIISAKKPNLPGLFKEIGGRRGRSGRTSVLLLGRYNHCEPTDWKVAAAKFPRLDVEFLTVHKSKGLEADYVILLDVSAGRYGFPSEIQSDPLMGLILPAEGEEDHAEERRVFYVALTRAREEVFIIAAPSRRSRFVAELEGEAYLAEVESDRTGLATAPCPACAVGRLVRVRKKKHGAMWVCSSHPYCDGSASLCGECQKAPMLRSEGALRCANPECTYSERLCPRCSASTLRVYETKKGPTERCKDRECGYWARKKA